jgi:hypothetical protein
MDSLGSAGAGRDNPVWEPERLAAFQSRRRRPICLKDPDAKGANDIVKLIEEWETASD